MSAVTQVGGKDVTREELLVAFNRVVDGGDWKGPILMAIDETELELTRKAVEFFTATELHVCGLPCEGTVVVTSIGYRAGPAA